MLAVVIKIGLYSSPTKVYISISGLTAIVASYILKVIENQNNVSENLFLKAANLPSKIITFEDIKLAYQLETNIFKSVFLVVEDGDSSTTKKNYLLFAAKKVIDTTVDSQEKFLVKSNLFSSVKVKIRFILL